MYLTLIVRTKQAQVSELLPSVGTTAPLENYNYIELLDETGIIMLS